MFAFELLPSHEVTLQNLKLFSAFYGLLFSTNSILWNINQFFSLELSQLNHHFTVTDLKIWKRKKIMSNLPKENYIIQFENKKKSIKPLNNFH